MVTLQPGSALRSTLVTLLSTLILWDRTQSVEGSSFINRAPQVGWEANRTTQIATLLQQGKEMQSVHK